MWAAVPVSCGFGVYEHACVGVRGHSGGRVANGACVGAHACLCACSWPGRAGPVWRGADGEQQGEEDSSPAGRRLLKLHAVLGNNTCRITSRL